MRSNLQRYGSLFCRLPVKRLLHSSPAQKAETTIPDHIVVAELVCWWWYCQRHCFRAPVYAVGQNRRFACARLLTTRGSSYQCKKQRFIKCRPQQRCCCWWVFTVQRFY